MADCSDDEPNPRQAADRRQLARAESALAVIRRKRRLLIQRRLAQVAAVADKARCLALEDAALVNTLADLDTIHVLAQAGDRDAAGRLAAWREAGRGVCRRGNGEALASLTRRQVRAEMRLAGMKRRMNDRAVALDAGRKAALGALVVRAGRHGLSPGELKGLAAALAQTLNAASTETIRRFGEAGLRHRRLLLASGRLSVKTAPRDLIALGAPLLAHGLDAWTSDTVLGGLIAPWLPR